MMGVRLTWWGRQRKQQHAVVGRIAAGTYPVPLTVISLGGAYKAFEPKFRALEGSKVM